MGKAKTFYQKQQKVIEQAVSKRLCILQLGNIPVQFSFYYRKKINFHLST